MFRQRLFPREVASAAKRRIAELVFALQPWITLFVTAVPGPVTYRPALEPPSARHDAGLVGSELILLASINTVLDDNELTSTDTP